MTNYKLKELIKIHNGTKYSHLEEGEVPLYGSGGIMSYVNDFLYEGEAVLLPRKGTLNNIMYVNSKIWTVDITADEFETKMKGFESNLEKLFAESKSLENEIQENLKSLKYD